MFAHTTSKPEVALALGAPLKLSRGAQPRLFTFAVQ
jgi:hypothetical protein